MIKKIIYSILILVLVMATVFAYFKTKKAVPAKPIHFHAGFIVFDNGKKVDLSAAKYMTIEPCKVDTTETPTATEIQHDKAHLHDGVGDVVHVHVKGSVWGDLFTNIDYPLDYSKVTTFINGQEVQNIKDTPIKAYDSVVMFVGTVDQKLLPQAVTIDHIKEVESTSETCGN